MLIFSGRLVFGQPALISVRQVNNQSFIDFKTSVGEVFRTLDVEKQNPYRNGMYCYDNHKSDTISYRSNQGQASNSNGTHIAVSYSSKAYSRESVQLQELGESMLIVYSHRGDVVFKKCIEADNALSPVISQDGRYVAVPFGGLVYDANTRRVGFSIYDLKTGIRICDLATSYVSGAWETDDVFVLSTSESAESSIYYVFDTRNAVLYKKKYTRDTYRWIKRFDRAGVVFALPLTGDRREEYDKHFDLVE